jgi:putative endopeptidase
MKITNKTLKSSNTEIQLPESAKSIKPGDNFYKHINGHWLNRTSIPPFKSSYGISEEVESLIEQQLSVILHKSYTFAEKGEKASTKREKMMDVIGRFMLSSLRESEQHNSVEFLQKNLRKLVCIRGAEDVGNYLGTFNRYGISTILTLNVSHRLNPDEYSFVIGKGSLGLPDISYYNGTGPGKTQTLLAYVNLCGKISKELHIEDVRGAVQTEAILAGVMDKYTDDSYEDIKGETLHTIFPNFPWDNLFESYGSTTLWKRKIIRIYNVKWIKYLEKLFKSWTSEAWTNLFSLHMILYSLPVLPSPYDTLHFEFFGKRLRGQVEKPPRYQMTMNLCKTILRIPLSYLYIEDYIPKDMKEKATKFVQTIQKHTIKNIETTDWLEEPTRKTAITKIKDMTLGIAYPASFPPIEIPYLITNNFLENMFLLAEMNTVAMIAKLSGSTAEIWDETPYTVNAYYFNERNRFLLPAASIQWPFYSQSKEKIGWNYGGLGAIIGHEITHAYDLDGKEYTGTGEKKNWWTRKDNLEYNKRVDKLVKLFDSGKILGHPVDGTLTMSENFADLGGLSIALDALKEELKGESATEVKKQMRDFFVSYAVSWRVKERARKVIQGLFLDVHAPAELRVNYIVSQFDDWYELFGVVTGDDLYIPPEERIKIF